MNSAINKWYSEPILPMLVHQVKLNAIHYTGKTRHQSVEIVETNPLGLILVLDGKTQSAQADEFIYHESLVHPAMVACPNPRSVLIAGGGEGATLREVLKHNTVERAVMVDVDGELVDICRMQLPTWHQGAFEDPRAEVIYGDALQYLRECRETFDVIIVDVNDPTEGGPSFLLYAENFYQSVRERLRTKGVMVTQAGPASLGTAAVMAAVSSTIASVFGRAHPYQADMLSFGCNWGFVLAGLDADPLALARAEIDRRLAARSVPGLRFYDGLAHQGIFGLPKWLRESIEDEKRIITEKNPIFSVF